MIAAYAFLAAFALQILTMSVLLPAWFIRYLRAQAASSHAEALARLYPGIDLDRAQARFLTQYRALTTGTAVLGLLLFIWLFSYVRRPDWDDGPVEALVCGYFFVAQMLPLALVAWIKVRFNKRPAPQSKRTAILERRGLFDFVSPFVVFLAALSYVLFAAFVIYLREHPFPGFAGLVNLVAVTLVYALNAVTVYAMLYGRKPNPLETHAARVHTIGLVVKSCFYSCIACVVFLSLYFALGVLDLQRWEPFALSVFLVITALLASRGYAGPLRPSRTFAQLDRSHPP